MNEVEPAGKRCGRCGRELADGLCVVCGLSMVLDTPQPSAGARLPYQGEYVLAEPIEVGDYSLLGEISHGGMGVVYRARQVSLNRTVAVKVLVGGTYATPEARKRFRREAQAVAKLQHPGIVPIYEVGEHEGALYFSMEYIDGQDLQAAIHDHPLPAAKAATCLRQVAGAVSYAHSQGVLHRDLKPHNVLIDPFDRARVTDFGLAKELDETPEKGLTVTEQPVGTPGFMPPEQVSRRHGPVGVWSDVYGLGATLYCLLTGRPPFQGEDHHALLEQILTAEPVAPRRLNASVPKDLETICLKCLEKEPGKRYGSAQAVADELGRFLAGEPIQARPAGPLERGWKWAGRRPVVAGLSAALVVVVLSGLIGVTCQWQRAERNAKAEGVQRAKTQAALSLMTFQRAQGHFDQGQRPSGLAWLANGARNDPTNRLLRDRLLFGMLESGSLCMPLHTLQHNDKVNSAQFSPNGLQVLTASDDKTAQVWDSLTGAPLGKPLRHQGIVRSAQFSPNGLWVVTASEDKTARVWDARTGSPLGKPLCHYGIVRSAQFSPSGLQVVTACDDKTAQVWDTLTGSPLGKPLRHETALRSAQFSPDGLRLVTVSADETVQVWATPAGEPVAPPLLEGSSAHFSPDGLRLVTTSSLLNCRVYSALTGQCLRWFPHVRDATFAQFSPDGLRLLTAMGDRTLRMWDAQTGRPLGKPLHHPRLVTWVHLSRDGLRVATVAGAAVRVWDTVTGESLVGPMHHADLVVSAQFSPDGLRVVTASRDGAARVWDARRSHPLSEWASGDGIHFNPRFGPADLREERGPWATRERLRAERWGRPFGLSLLPPARTFVSQDQQMEIRVYNDNTAQVCERRLGKPVGRPLRHEDTIHSGRFSRDGLKVITASADNTAQVWDAQTGQPLGKPLRHENRVTSAVFSPDGLLVATASWDQTARVWDARTSQAVGEPLRHEALVESAEFSPDGSRLVTTSSDMTARVWDARTGQPLSEPLCHEASVASAQFTPDGQRIVTALVDRSARIWDAPQLGNALFVWSAQAAELTAGLRIGQGGLEEELPMAERQVVAGKLRSVGDVLSATNPAGICLRWLLSDPGTRTISPFSVVTVPEYLARIPSDNAYALRLGLAICPTNALLLARLAACYASTEPNTNLLAQGDAEFLSQRATTLNPLDAEVWSIRSKVLSQGTNMIEALAAVERALHCRTNDMAAWNLRTDLLERMGRDPEAIVSYDSLVRMLEADGSTNAALRSDALLAQSRILARLNRSDEALAARLKALGLTARTKNTPPELLDLSAHYNAALGDDWHNPADAGNNLAALPIGRGRYGTHDFDVRGIVQLSSSELTKTVPGYPEVASGIPVRQKCRALRFLHGLGWPEADGTTIAHYVVRYADGGSNAIKVVYGRDVRNWQFWPEGNAQEKGGAEPIWKGPQARWKQHWPNWGVRLYVQRWTNPRPDMEIATLDLISTMTKSAPFIIAITVEP